MKLFDGKDIFVKYSIISLFLTLLAFVFTIPFFFFQMMDIPLGLLVGGLFQSGFFYLFHLAGRNMKLLMAFQISRTVLLAGLTVLFAFMFNNGGLKLFNPFAFLGAYVVILIIYIILARKERNDGWFIQRFLEV